MTNGSWQRLVVLVGHELIVAISTLVLLDPGETAALGPVESR